MDLNKRVFWKASLSSGETFYEGKGKFAEVTGELSPWKKLLRYVIDKNLEITSLSLTTQKKGETHTFNLPSAGKNPKFSKFAQAEKPLDYTYCNHIAQERRIVNNQVKKSKVVEWYACIEAIYSDYKLQIWVDELNPNNSWTLVVRD